MSRPKGSKNKKKGDGLETGALVTVGEALKIVKDEREKIIQANPVSFNISIQFIGGDTLTGTGTTALEALQSIPRPDKIVGKAIFKIWQGDKKKEMLFMPAKLKRIFYEKAQPVLIKWLALGLK